MQPSDLILDMCAAPGSKTCQILESLHWSDQSGSGSSRFQLCTGGVLCNDVEWKRANMLTHQVQRIGSPGVGVLNTDACFFPLLKKVPVVPETTPNGAINDPSSTGVDGGVAGSSAAAVEPTVVRFDKVLCDVPCSGDGTLRKTPNIWRTWTVADGLGLHHRQSIILWRGLDVLKVGGRLVYSTCSLNPMENESVIAHALEKCEGAVELVAPNPSFAEKGLVGREGLTHWLVPHPKQVGRGDYGRGWS